jgi:Putative auto-transporter adhesin, head GIN domain
MSKRFQLLVITVAILASCTKEKITGSGNIITQQRNVSSFTQVKMFGANNVTIVQGNTFNVTVKGYSNLLPHYQSNVSGGILELKYSNNSNVNNDNIEVAITMPALTGAGVHGSGNINCNGNFTGNNSFEATISGSGNITMQQGDAQHLNATISGSGNLYAFGFLTGIGDIKISGSGNAEIVVANQLKAKITGSGNIYYKGNPVIDANISGSGAVIKR